MAQSFPFEYDTMAPGPTLDPYVESLWYARGRVPYERERIAPTGSTVAVFVLGDPVLEIPDNGEGTGYTARRGFLLGPHARPVINQPLGETHAVGVVTTPVGCESLFGVPPGEIRARVVDLEESWPEATALRSQLANLATPRAKMETMRHQLEKHLQPVPGVDRCARAVSMLEANPTRPIAGVARELEITHEHLDREFTQIVGITPSTLARILRMRLLLSELDVAGEVKWAEVAVELGWFDQSHLIRDFKRHTGVTPSAYVAAQNAYLDPEEPGEFAGFIPEI